MEFLVQESQELEGTGKVTLRVNRPNRLNISSGNTVQLQFQRQSCGAIIDTVQQGDDIVMMDKHLRLHLRSRSGETISVEPFECPEAIEIQVSAPFAWTSPEGGRIIHSLLNDRPVCQQQKIPVYTLTGSIIMVEVEKTNPDCIVLITDETAVNVERQLEKEQAAGITYQDIGGLGQEIQRVRELVEFPLRSPESFAKLGIEPPRGIILYGPPGTGKTLIAKALSNEVGSQFFLIQGPEIMSSYYGASEQKLREIFDKARQSAPAVILMDELDAISVKREQTRGDLEQRVVATLLSLMDGLTDLGEVLVIGTTNRLNAIDPALRRPGRFEHEIHIGVPDLASRNEILAIHTRRMPLADDVDLQYLAEKTPGFVGADLAALCREAGYSTIRRCVPPENLEQGDFYIDENTHITSEDFQSALGVVQPSAMREVMIQVPRDITWDDIGGLDDVKRLITESVIYGIQKADAYKAAGIHPAKGLLLYGPPGTGKTLLAKAVANECGANFIAIRGPEVRSKWFGESEEKIRFIFSRAREATPCVIFFDEIDAIAPTRGRDISGLTDSIVNQLLAEMDGIVVAENVFTIAATNMADLLDPALLRPGRFDLQVLVPLPDQTARRRIFQVHLKNTPLKQDVDLAYLAAQTENRSGADIAEICRLAALYALREVDFSTEGLEVTMSHFHQAIKEVAQTHQQLVPRQLGFTLPEQEK